MLKLFVAILFLLFSLSAFSQSKTNLVYSDLNLSLPSSFSLVGDIGGKQNILIFRYGNVKGSNFIAFTDMSKDSTVDYGCSANVFFNSVFSNRMGSGCNNSILKIMRETFVEGKDVATWTVDSYSVNLSAGDSKTFVFISSNNGKLVKIDSDFLDKKAFKKMLENL